MDFNDFNKIDWSTIWREGILFFAGEADKEESWNGIAPRWNQIQHKDDYGKKVLQRIKIKPSWTVLDVGCGAGLLAVPLAKKCKQVTGLDISSEMLKFLAQNAKKEKVHNITTTNKAFETVVIGKDIEQHDIVVASRSMGWERNLEKFLKNMDEAAKRRAYIIWGARERTFDIAMYNAIGRPYGETRMYIVIYNLLYQMGIRANIDMFDYKAKNMSHNSIEDAFTSFQKRFARRGNNEELTKEEEKKLKKFLTENLKKASDGTVRFVDKKPAREAVIWWEK
ncbi:MAG: class I SAM-dependent methyltransferase [Candidatus Bathyarchaeia archaeon]